MEVILKKMLSILSVVLLMVRLVACSEHEESINRSDVEMNDIEAVETIRIAVMNDYSPYIIYENDELSGPYIEIISTVMENLGYEYELVPLPWSRLLSAVETGEVDMALPLFDKPERRSLFYYSEEPIGLNQITLIGRSDSQASFSGSMLTLSDHSIGVVQDYFYSDDFEQAIIDQVITIDTAISSDENIEKLLQKRVDLIVEDPEVVKTYLKDHDIETTMQYIEHPITQDYSHIVFTRTKDLSVLRRGVDEALNAMKTERVIYDIYARYDMSDYIDTFIAVEEKNPPASKFFQDKTNTPLSIGILDDTKPYVYREDGELTGFTVEFLTEIMTRIGVEYEFRNIPFSRMLEELKTGSLDIGVDLYLKPEREVYAIYPDLPFTGYPTVIFKKASNDFTFSGDLDALKGYTIGYVREYSIGPLDAEKDTDKYKFVVTDSPEQNVENLANGRVDLIIDIKSTGENIISEMDLTDEIVSVEPAIYYDYSYVVFSRASNLQKLVEEYEMTVLSMFEDGTIEKLSIKYGLPYLEFEELK
jgi:polar amino acid transport system substrate-binding protein